MALLASAGLLARSFWQLHAVDPGFDASQVVGVNMSVPNTLSRADRVQFYRRALEEIRAIPGVDGAGLISFLPPETRSGVFMGLAIDGDPLPPGAQPRVVNTLISSAGYFQTLRMRLASGRDFLPSDTGSRKPVIIVNETLVRRYLNGAGALGRRIGTGFDGMKPIREIVGVVRDSHDRGVAADPVPTAYIPYEQFSLPYGSLVVRTALPPGSVIPVIRERVGRVNPAVPLFDFQTLAHRFEESLREPRFYMLVAGGCAALAMLFVTFGLYGLISYTVSRRAREIGIRVALGARRDTIVRLVVGQGARIAIAGVVLGTALAWLTTRYLQSLLFRVEPLDGPTLAAAAALVVTVTLGAAALPARRATGIDPVSALKRD
jgi:putative ABC transport system permease protein